MTMPIHLNLHQAATIMRIAELHRLPTRLAQFLVAVLARTAWRIDAEIFLKLHKQLLAKRLAPIPASLRGRHVLLPGPAEVLERRNGVQHGGLVVFVDILIVFLRILWVKIEIQSLDGNVGHILRMLRLRCAPSLEQHRVSTTFADEIIVYDLRCHLSNCMLMLSLLGIVIKVVALGYAKSLHFILWHGFMSSEQKL